MVCGNKFNQSVESRANSNTNKNSNSKNKTYYMHAWHGMD